MLPNLPVNSTKRAVDTVAFLGLNRTENFRDGEMRDMQNLSAAEFPTLTQRQKRIAIPPHQVFSDPTDIFEWDGKLVVVDGTELKYGNRTIGEVNPGKKQFAVVNTKLCIWPDKVYIDLTNNTVGHLDAELTTGTQAGTVMITDDSITALVTQMVAQNVYVNSCWYNDRLYDITSIMAAYTYGVDPAEVEACYQNGAWNMEELAALQQYKQFAGTAGVKVGDILIPKYYSPTTYPYLPVCGYYSGSSIMPDTSQYNTDGYYMIVTNCNFSDTYKNFRAAIYRVGTGNALFSGTFKVGDAVNISGTRFAIADVKHAVVTEIDDTANKLTFSEGTLNAPIAYYIAASDIPATNVRLLGITQIVNNLWFKPTTTIQEGRVLWVSSDESVIHVWNTETKREEAQYDVIAAVATDYSYNLVAYDPIPVEGSPIIIGKDVPDLDFICAKDNRLWGVSNSQENEAYNAQTGKIEKFTSRVIYASALGDPSNWWVFQGVDTDSYQVAVGSEGDFTAIVPLDGVCCWKENRLHKILGSYPSEYYMSEYQVDGVAAGNGRSCTVVNDVLYYAGRNGMFAFAGSRPQEIGQALGGPMENAVGGSDGKCWYLSGQRSDGEYELLTFDLERGLWMREDATKTEAFANLNGTLFLLAGNQGHWDSSTPPVWIEDPNVVYRCGQGADSSLQWYAEFCPYFEMSSSRYASTALRRRYYLRTHLRLEMAAGSSVKVEVNIDDLGWQTVRAVDTDIEAVKSVEIPPRRCDKMVLRISGTGAVKLRHMAREYLIGSERP